MKKIKPVYKLPKITKQKIRVNFYSSSNRSLDSLNPFDGFIEKVYASGLCFLAKTKIPLANGGEKNIEDVKPNCQILSYDISNDKYVPNTVTELLIHKNEAEDYILINGTLKVTKNHRLWTNSNSWKRVDELKIGDILRTINHKYITVQSLEHKQQINTVYNLHLAQQPHNFFAGGILVHNSSTGDEKM